MIAKLWRTFVAIFTSVPVPATIEPAKSRRGRPRTYDPHRPATAIERKRRQRWVTDKGCHENDFRDCHENRPLKEEEKKEGVPISRNWRPDRDTERECKEMIGDHYEADLADHIDYCLKTDFRCHDHNAAFRRRCRALQRNPQLRLDLRPRARQFGVKDGGRAKQREPPVERITRLADETIRARKSAAPPTSPDDNAKVQSKLDWFLGRGSKGASG